VYHVHSKGATDDTAQQKNTDYVRDKERRQQAARLKKLVYGSAFSGIPILRQLDVTAPSYWLSSAALVGVVVLFVRCPLPFCNGTDGQIHCERT
jgi:hypothetical protein